MAFTFLSDILDGRDKAALISAVKGSVVPNVRDANDITRTNYINGPGIFAGPHVLTTVGRVFATLHQQCKARYVVGVELGGCAAATAAALAIAD